MRVSHWKTETVTRYLQFAFAEASAVEATPRGAAELFVVQGRKNPQSPSEVLHQLWVGPSFFDRYSDPMSLRDALVGADVVQALKRARDKVVQLQ